MSPYSWIGRKDQLFPVLVVGSSTFLLSRAGSLFFCFTVLTGLDAQRANSTKVCMLFYHMFILHFVLQAPSRRSGHVTHIDSQLNPTIDVEIHKIKK